MTLALHAHEFSFPGKVITLTRSHDSRAQQESRIAVFFVNSMLGPPLAQGTLLFQLLGTVFNLKNAKNKEKKFYYNVASSIIYREDHIKFEFLFSSMPFCFDFCFDYKKPLLDSSV